MVGLMGLVFLFLALLFLAPLFMERTIKNDDLYAALFLSGCFGLISSLMFWLVFDMGRKDRQMASMEEMNAAVMPHMMNLSDDIAVGDDDGGSDGAGD
jgi:cytochrome bd-type quinol oxidase subunit 1